ncbi:hypothetical protein [Paraburkholderia sp. BCC1885]|uniref:hypothetical protein n=1 Tax=Paraburkholderia sp. BCC1885 TaxID=2562669 RepID=UPI001183BA4A|nr:hypothetical protein [Paraburkholderia sp. BCC1885]
MHEVERRSSREISESQPNTLQNLVDLVKRDALKLVGGAILGAAIGYGASYLLPREWQSTVVVRLGQLYNGTAGALVETPANLVTRIQQISFQQDVLKNLGLGTDPAADPRVKLFKRSTRAKIIGTDLVEIDVNGFSPEETQRQLNALVAQIAQIHKQMMDPSITRLNADLNEANQRLAQAETRATTLTGAADRQLQAKGGAQSSPVDILLTELINDNAREIGTIQQRKAELLEQLDPERSFNTRPLVAGSVSDSPVFPKRGVMLFAGMFVGIGFALSWALMSSSRASRAVQLGGRS